MFKKLTLAAAAGAGYVLGAKAGTQRYEQIMTKFREIAGMPAVQSATSSVQQTAAPLVSAAKDTVTDKVSSATDKASGKLGGTGTTGSTGATTTTPAAGTGATTRSTAAAGAAPSVTAPTTRP